MQGIYHGYHVDIVYEKSHFHEGLQVGGTGGECSFWRPNHPDPATTQPPKGCLKPKHVRNHVLNSQPFECCHHLPPSTVSIVIGPIDSSHISVWRFATRAPLWSFLFFFCIQSFFFFLLLNLILHHPGGRRSHMLHVGTFAHLILYDTVGNRSAFPRSPSLMLWCKQALLVPPVNQKGGISSNGQHSRPTKTWMTTTMLAFYSTNFQYQKNDNIRTVVDHWSDPPTATGPVTFLQVCHFTVSLHAFLEKNRGNRWRDKFHAYETNALLNEVLGLNWNCEIDKFFADFNLKKNTTIPLNNPSIPIDCEGVRSACFTKQCCSLIDGSFTSNLLIGLVSISSKVSFHISREKADATKNVQSWSTIGWYISSVEDVWECVGKESSPRPYLGSFSWTTVIVIIIIITIYTVTYICIYTVYIYI